MNKISRELPGTCQSPQRFRTSCIISVSNRKYIKRQDVISVRMIHMYIDLNNDQLLQECMLPWNWHCRMAQETQSMDSSLVDTTVKTPRFCLKKVQIMHCPFTLIAQVLFFSFFFDYQILNICYKFFKLAVWIFTNTYSVVFWKIHVKFIIDTGFQTFHTLTYWSVP